MTNNRLCRIFAVAVTLVAVAMVAAPAFADAIRYELVLAGTLPGDPASKVRENVTNGTIVGLDLYMLVQGDDGNTANDALKIGTGYLTSSNGGLLGDYAVSVLDNPFTFTAIPGVPGDRDGDGDLDLGTTGDVSTGTTNGFNAAYNPPTGPFLADGTIPAAALGTVGDAWAYAKLLTVNWTVNDPALALGDSAQLQFLSRGAVSAHQSVADGANFNRNGNTASPVLVGLPVVVSAPIPEPSTLALAAIGLVGLGFSVYRRRS